MIPIQDKGEGQPIEQPVLIEKFADNGEHSHWELVNDDGETIWSEEDKGESRQLFEWVKASEDMPTGKKVMPIRTLISDTEYLYDAAFVNDNGGYGHKIIFQATNGYYLVDHVEWLKPIQSSLNEEKVFFIEDAMELFNLYADKQITIGKLTELLNEKCSGQSSLTPKSIRDSEAELLEEIRQIKAVIIHFATLDKMPTLELLDRDHLIAYIVTIAQKILRDYPPKKHL